MISCNMSPLQAQRSTNNISSVLRKDILGVLLGFIDLETLPLLTKLNRRFKTVISDEKILPIFSEYIKEREKSREILQNEPIIIYHYKSNFFGISVLRRRLAIKYNSTQVSDFLTELTKSILNKLTKNGNGELNLSRCDIGKNPQNLKTLFEALKVNKTITVLNLERNSLGLGGDPQNLKTLFEFLKVNKTITVLNLGGNFLGRDTQDLTNLSEALKVNQTITELNLYANSLGDDPQNLKNLSEALKVNKTITKLNLCGSAWGYNPQNITNLSEALKVNKTISELNLCGIFCFRDDPQNLKTLCEALKVNESITVLYLPNNSINADPENLEILSEALKVNKTITQLDLRYNDLAYKFRKELGQIRSNLDINTNPQ